MPHFEFDGKDTYYEIHGEGEPLLLLHGNATSSTLFKNHTPNYAKKYQVILIDFPGLGKSERLERFRDDYWKYNADGAIHLLDYLNIKKVRVIGTSGGALVGLNMCLLRKDTVTHLIADSFFGDRLSEQEADLIIERRRKAKSEYMSQQYWKNHIGDDWDKVLEDDLALMKKVSHDHLPIIHGNLSRIEAKVLGIATSGDDIIPNILEKVEKTMNKIPNAKTEFFESGRHTFMITQKEEFDKVAMPFLES